jgi:hypothetical protein
MNLWEAWKKRWVLVIFVASMGAGLVTTLSYRWHRERVAQASAAAAGAYCDRGIAAAKARTVTAPLNTPMVSAVAPADPNARVPKINTAKPGGKKRVHRRGLRANSATAAGPSSR